MKKLTFINSTVHVQGDTSRCIQPPVDMKTKVVFKYMLLIVKRKYRVTIQKGTNLPLT